MYPELWQSVYCPNGMLGSKWNVTKSGNKTHISFQDVGKEEDFVLMKGKDMNFLMNADGEQASGPVLFSDNKIVILDFNEANIVLTKLIGDVLEDQQGLINDSMRTYNRLVKRMSSQVKRGGNFFLRSWDVFFQWFESILSILETVWFAMLSFIPAIFAMGGLLMLFIGLIFVVFLIWLVFKIAFSGQRRNNTVVVEGTTA